MSGKVLFIVPYPLERAPSQRFRVELYEPYLKKSSMDYRIVPFMDTKTWNILYQQGSVLKKAVGIVKGYFKRLRTVFFEVPGYDYIFIHREAAPMGPAVLEWIISRVLRKKVIYDFDDAIWMPNTSHVNRIARWFKSFGKIESICRLSYKVVGGNAYLCGFARQFNSSTILIPTCVDVVLKHNRVKTLSAGKTVVGWTGSHSTLEYLDEIIPVIRELQEVCDFTFMVIADKKPDIVLDHWEFVKWSEQTEIEDLLRLDIGVMPLRADQWSEGKCGFKLIQYLSLGIPAVADPVGVNAEIIEDGVNGYLCDTREGWKSCLENLITQPDLRNKMGEKGREKIVNEYSIQSQREKFLALFS